MLYDLDGVVLILFGGILDNINYIIIFNVVDNVFVDSLGEFIYKVLSVNLLENVVIVKNGIILEEYSVFSVVYKVFIINIIKLFNFESVFIGSVSIGN